MKLNKDQLWTLANLSKIAIGERFVDVLQAIREKEKEKYDSATTEKDMIEIQTKRKFIKSLIKNIANAEMNYTKIEEAEKRTNKT